MIINFINLLGTATLSLCDSIGTFVLFLFTAISTLFTTRLHIKQVIVQMHRIGVESISINFLTGLAAGFALALQTYIGLSRFGGEELLGVVVALGMTRELGPVFTGIMVTGRAGSSMAAELGTMQISEQIDALRTLCINPYQYLIVPRILASALILPFLTTFAILCGIIGGYIYSVNVLEISSEAYISNIQAHVELNDIVGGLIKSSFFGLILAWVGSYMGFHTIGGARGVGKATTKSVVFGSIMILIANYFLSSLLFKIGAS
jgi:phospholipid/cholesterol/gamma-HCH transport system permease protein